ncbi:fumarylacetoacetate (FAA) hydrolase [Streptomyces sp. NPDC047525]|uniref:fumarylacetoacetate (FAA) hydrolase n=1 Tax=Streptomyces sp. NPDC047525 TaxID=3155264 RepID=UPI0033ED6EEC
MSILFECEYEGERYAGFTRPVPGQELALYKVSPGQVQAAIIAEGGARAAVRALTREIAPVTVDGAAELRTLPPLLPTGGDTALVSGFMRTHKSKYEDEPTEATEFVAPNWFFKGFGGWLRMPDQTLTVPAKAVALIEEPEVALVYVNDDEGTPHYAGYTFANDLCDIGLHRQNPGWNPYCKLCDTSITPWLFLDEPPRTVTGTTVIERGGVAAWQGTFDCGADALYFKVQDMADNLFEYPALRRPGLVNYVLLGADEASFHDGFRIADGDRIKIDVKSHDVTLANPVRFGGTPGTE